MYIYGTVYTVSANKIYLILSYVILNANCLTPLHKTDLTHTSRQGVLRLSAETDEKKIDLSVGHHIL